jgi:hypothetical protein
VIAFRNCDGFAARTRIMPSHWDISFKVQALLLLSDDLLSDQANWRVCKESQRLVRLARKLTSNERQELAESGEH